MRVNRDQPNYAVRTVCVIVDRAISGVTRARRAVRGYASVDRFASRGVGLDFDPDGHYTYESIYLGDNVSLGMRPTLLASHSTIRIGDNVMFGPEVTIRGGNHRFDVVGLPIRSVTEAMKRAEDDLGVVIEEDVWVGGRSTILHGVTIGRGCVIGAGSVVTKSIPAYSVAAGVPAKVIRRRWDDDTIREHEKILYRAPGGGAGT